MAVFAGQGDPRRSMSLLWRAGSGAATRPGRKPRLDVDSIVAAAITVADANGMTGLSMRAVGEQLGHTAMALYTHVPNKSDLIDLMYDQCLAELPNTYPPTDGWRTATTAWARDLWTFYLRHPWVLQVSSARPVLGPNEFALQETVVRILADTIPDARTLWRVVGALLHLIRGAAQAIAETRHAPAATGMSDEDWWYARVAILTEVAPDFADRYPTLTTLENQGAFEMADETVPYLEQEARETFEVGLTVFLDGIEATIG
ncbi:MAG: TetR/AcrR family transcriptional regulator C-terminal domain-containing protein [Actinomycetota bacterium]|nr:TetR/AcrR family transcriptional regulator C-terminal domain-containing protein [Actinomycetota bacterium]